MKNVSLLISVILISIFVSEATAQKKVTTIRQVTDFNAIEISSGIDLYITQGSRVSIKIEAADDIQKTIFTKVHNGTLEIYAESDNILNWSLWSKKMKAYVTVPTLTKLSASGGSDVYSQGAWKVNELKMNASGGSDIKFDFIGSKVDCVASGGSDLILGGKVSILAVSASGGSDIKSYELHAIKVTATATGGSDVQVNVSTELNASANGGSDIYYSGNPAKVSKNSSGGSDITKKD